MAAPTKTHVVEGVLALGIALAVFKAVTSLVHIITTTAPDFLQYYESQTSVLPPVSRFLYLPLQLLPLQVSQGVWVIASFGCLIWVVWQLGRHFGLAKRTIVAASILAFFAFPTRFTLGMGQVNLITLACLVSAVAHSSGMWFAIAVLLKPELMFMIIPIVIQKKWRILALMIVVASLMIFGWGYKFPEFRWAGASMYYNQGLSGLISRAGGPFWLYITVSMILLAIRVHLLRNKKIKFSETVWRFLPTFILIEPIAWQHHFVFLIPTVLFLWSTHKTFRIRIGLLLSYALVSWNFASSGFLATMPLGWLVASHGTLGVLILWILSL